MHQNGVLPYLHSSHPSATLRTSLGSTALATTSGGALHSSEQYFAYGKPNRLGVGTNLPTDNTYTGQKSDGSGLMYYGARFYDPQIGLFVSPDTIVPDAGRVFAYNRSMYVYGNPLSYNDPSGHDACGTGANEYCDEYLQFSHLWSYQEFLAGRAAYYKYASNPDLLLQHMLVINGAASGNIDAINQTISQAEFYGGHYQGGRALASLFSEDYAISAIAAAGAPNDRGQVNEGKIVATAMIMAGVLGGLSSNGGCSFNANTQVTTIDGEKAIVLVREGDKVLAWNQETGTIGYYTVTDTHAHLDRVLVYLTIDGETILTTPEHPFFTESGEWVGAGDLRVGSKVHQIDGDLGTVRKVDVVEQLQLMYNLTVADAHTFVVGDGQWLVHNVCGAAKQAGLPTSGKIRYVPPEGWTKNSPLPRGSGNGYMDKFGNEWVRGPSRTPGQAYEWDVQLSRTGQAQLGKYSPDGQHLNVSLDGEITH